MKKIYLLLILSFILIGCQKEEIFSVDTDIKYISLPYDSLPENVLDFLKVKNLNKSETGERTFGNFGSINPVIPARWYAKSNGEESYTFSLKKPSQVDLPSNYFDNLVLSGSKGKLTKAKIIRYYPDSSWKPEIPFSGKIEFYSTGGNYLGYLDLINGQKKQKKSRVKGFSTSCSYELESVFCSEMGDSSTHSCTYTFAEECTTTYTPERTTYSIDDGSEGSYAGGGGGTSSGGTTTSPIPEEEEEDPNKTECIMDPDGNCIGEILEKPTEEEDKIYVELDDKELCAYQRLNYAGVNATNYHNLMTQLFTEFGEGNISNSDLIITSEDLGYSGGKSVYLGDGKFKIIISNMSDRSSIEIAAVILHEMSHAFLAKHYLLYTKSFAELYSMYINDTGIENYSHDIMKDKFLGRMAQTLQDYDSTLFSNFEDYITLASPGVYSNYSVEQVAEIKRIKNYALQNDSRCTISK